MFHMEHLKPCRTAYTKANTFSMQTAARLRKRCCHLPFHSLILCTVNWARPTLARRAMKRQTRAKMFTRPFRGRRVKSLSTTKKNITKYTAVNTSIKKIFMAVLLKSPICLRTGLCGSTACLQLYQPGLRKQQIQRKSEARRAWEVYFTESRTAFYKCSTWNIYKKNLEKTFQKMRPVLY